MVDHVPGLLVRSPRPPYPAQALQMHITGDVRVRMTVQGGNVVDAEASWSANAGECRSAIG